MTEHTELDTSERTETSDTTVTRRATLRAAGIAGAGALALGTTAGSAAATEPCVDCVRFGKVEGQPEEGDRYEFTVGEYTVVIEVEDVGTEDGEAVRLSWKVLDLPDSDYLAVCRVDVKGGPQTRTITYEGGDSPGAYSAGAHAPAMHDRNPNRERYAISYLEFWVCVPKEMEEEAKEPRRGGPPSGRGRGR